MSTVKVFWKRNSHIETELNSEKIKFCDRLLNEHHHGGVNPTELFLSSVIGCSSTTVLSLMKRDDIAVEHLETFIITDETSSVDTPYNIERFRIKYVFEGTFSVDQDKLIECVESAHKKYSPMIHITEKIAPIQFEIHNNGVMIYKSKNWQQDIDRECNSEICEPYYFY